MQRSISPQAASRRAVVGQVGRFFARDSQITHQLRSVCRASIGMLVVTHMWGTTNRSDCLVTNTFAITHMLCWRGGGLDWQGSVSHVPRVLLQGLHNFTWSPCKELARLMGMLGSPGSNRAVQSIHDTSMHVNWMTAAILATYGNST